MVYPLVRHIPNFEVRPQALRHFEQISQLQEQIESAETRAALAFSSAAALPGPEFECQWGCRWIEKKVGHIGKHNNKNIPTVPRKWVTLQWMFDCGFTRWQKEEDGNVRHSPQKLGCNRGIQFQQRTNRYPFDNQTWLVDGLEHDFYDFPYIGNNHPNWLIFFRGVGLPPTRWHSIWKILKIPELMTGRQDGIFDEGNVAAADFQTQPLATAHGVARFSRLFGVWTVNGEVKFPNGERWKMWVYSWKRSYDSKVGL